MHKTDPLLNVGFSLESLEFAVNMRTEQICVNISDGWNSLPVLGHSEKTVKPTCLLQFCSMGSIP